MKLKIERTNRIREFQGQTVRVWHGTSDDGSPCEILVAAMIGPSDEAARESFESALAVEGVPHVPLCQRQRLHLARTARKAAAH